MRAGVWLGNDNFMHIVSRFNRLLLALSVALFGWESSKAEFSLPESVQVHGFASLGYFNTTDNNYFGNTKDDSGDFDFWEMGINGSWRPLPDLQLSMQVVSRKAGETDDGDLRIDYGFLDYNFMSDVDDVLGVRGGRIVTPLGLYNDTRDMPFTRPSILLPQSIYLDINRQFALSSDGGQLYSQYRTDYGDFLFQFFGGLPRVDDPDLMNIFTRGVFPGRLESESSFGGRLVYEKDGGLVRLAITGIQANVGYDSRGPGDLRPGSFTFEPLVFSAQYNAEQWSLTGEYARRRSKFKDFGPSLPDRDFTGESFYVQGTYRFMPRWETMLRYDVLWWDTDDRDGKRFEAATGGLVAAHSRFAKDWTIGIRWDITPSIMVRAEYHNVDGTGWVSDLDNPGGTKRYWNLFALLAAYRF
jgi:hypothetical protein